MKKTVLINKLYLDERFCRACLDLVHGMTALLRLERFNPTILMSFSFIILFEQKVFF